MWLMMCVLIGYRLPAKCESFLKTFECC